MNARLSSLALLLVLASASGCGPAPTEVDAATGDAGPGTDAATLPPSRIFGACVDDSQCPGEGGFCRTAEDGYPGGYCTLACEDRTPCDDGAVYNHCLTLAGATESTCESRCRNGEDCRSTYSCSLFGTTMEGVCIPVCSSDEDCGGGAHCNQYSGRCAASVPTTGGETGDACTGDAQCRSGNCRPEVNGATPTGYIHGYCDGPCRLPAGYNTSDFFGGDTLPAGTCAGDAICIPGNQYGEGDLGTCLDACLGDEDCREGYGCLTLIAGHQFTNGICIPRDCTGGACPAGYSCVQVPDGSGGSNGFCGPT